MEGARPASSADLEVIVGLHDDAVTEQRDQRGGSVWVRHGVLAQPAEALTAALDDPAQLLLVGTVDDTVVGYALVEVGPLQDGEPLGVIREIYVEPEARSIGVGECLIDDVLAWCRTQGCVGVDALALPGNRQTKNFFETFGFTARAIVVHRSLADER